MIPKSGVLSLFLRVLVHTMDSICQSADPPPSGSKRERMGTVGALKKIVGGGAATVSTPKLVCRMRQEQKWPWCWDLMEGCGKLLFFESLWKIVVGFLCSLSTSTYCRRESALCIKDPVPTVPIRTYCNFGRWLDFCRYLSFKHRVTCHERQGSGVYKLLCDIIHYFLIVHL